MVRTHVDLAKGVFLYTTKTLNPLSFHYEIESATTNAVEICISFEGSDNICAIQDGNILSASTISRIAQPFQRCKIGTLRAIDRLQRTHLKFAYTWNAVEADESIAAKNRMFCDRQNIKIGILLKEAIESNSSGYSKLNKLYIDVDFPPTSDSYYKMNDEKSYLSNEDDHESSVKSVRKAEKKNKKWYKYPDLIPWKRPSDFMEEEYNIFPNENKIFPSDIRQGFLGNSSFTSNLACLTENSEFITEKIFQNCKKKNFLGKYEIRLCHCGVWCSIMIDDYFPCFPGPGGGPIGTRGHDNSLWILLIEKAYAKSYGSYMALENGFFLEAFIDLTGVPYRTINLSHKNTAEMIKNGNLKNLLLEYSSRGESCLITATCPKGRKPYLENSNISNTENLSGLLPGISYSILKIMIISSGICLIEMRNPWGEGGMEWNGDWSDTCPLWTQEIKVSFEKDVNLNILNISSL